MLRMWTPEMSAAEERDLAYWERNMLALAFAEGWYNDDKLEEGALVPNMPGWRRVLTLNQGKMCFHIPDDFNVGDLHQVKRNWDGHTTEEKWARVCKRRNIACP